MATSSQERVAVVKECIEYKDPVGIKKLILEDKFRDDSYFWELITLLGTCITQENLEQCQGFVEVCERCINYIIKVGNASELVLALLEQADSFDDTVKFQSFLPIIQNTLLRLESKQQFSLELTLETLSDCIRNLELPKSLDLEGEERRAHDLDPEVDKINKYLVAYLEFLKPFVQQVSSGHEADFKGENFQRQVDCLLKYLMFVLDHPLVFLDVTAINSEEDPRRIKSDSRLCAEILMQLLLTMYPNIDNLVQKLLGHNEKVRRLQRHKNWMEKRGDGVCDGVDADDELVPELGLSCLAYLIHHERLTTSVEDTGVWLQARGPSCLYPPHCILESNLPFVLALLQRRESEVQRKGVLLLETLVAMQTDATELNCEDLDKPQYFAILNAMFDIMIYCSVKDIRLICLKQVPVFIALFNPEARYRIYTKLFATLKHAGAYGFCIQLFKSQLEEIPRTENSDAKQCSQFFNLGLNRIFNLITRLSDGPATDFVESSDKVIAVLNLCRYIVLRDPPNVNQTGFWNFLQKVEKEYLSQLQTGLDMAKGHYKLELTGLTGGKKQAENQEVEMSVCVAGFKLPKMELGQKMGILRQALNTLDLVSSLLARLNEVIDQQKQQAKA